MTMKNNNGLVSKAIAGDKAAFEELYNEYSDKVYFFALRNVGSEDAARDITSETFANAFESIGTLQSEKSFSNWLFSIAYKKCIDHLRVINKNDYYEDSEQLEKLIEYTALDEPVMLPDDYAANKETAEQLKAVVDGMPASLRSAVLLYYYEDMPVSEVAKTLGISENHAKNKLFRARKLLRKKLEKLIGSGAVFAAVPLRNVIHTAFADSSAGLAISGGAKVAGIGLTVKIAVLGTAVAVAVGVPIAVHKSSGGDYRPEENKFSYCKLDELEQDFENAKSEKYDKLKLDSGLTINTPNELCGYNIYEEGANRELGKKLIDEYGFSDLCSVFDDDKSVFLVNYSAAKQLTLRKDGYFACYFRYDDITENNDLVYFRNQKSDKDTSAILKTAQDFMDSYSSLINSVSFTPLYLNNSNGVSQIFCSRNINGYFQPCYMANYTDKGAINPELFYGVWIQGEIVVSTDGTVSAFTDNSGKMQIKSVNETYNEMISASSVISFMDKCLADNMECKVDDVSLVQMRQYSENERTPKDIKGLDCNDNDSEYVTHPYWQIIITSLKNDSKRYVAIFDCITGEFAFTSIL